MREQRRAVPARSRSDTASPDRAASAGRARRPPGRSGRCRAAPSAKAPASATLGVALLVERPPESPAAATRSPTRASPSIAMPRSAAVLLASCAVNSGTLAGCAMCASASSAASAGVALAVVREQIGERLHAALVAHRAERLHRRGLDRAIVVVERRDHRVADRRLDRLVLRALREHAAEHADRGVAHRRIRRADERREVRARGAQQVAPRGAARLDRQRAERVQRLEATRGFSSRAAVRSAVSTSRGTGRGPSAQRTGRKRRLGLHGVADLDHERRRASAARSARRGRCSARPRSPRAARRPADRSRARASGTRGLRIGRLLQQLHRVQPRPRVRAREIVDRPARRRSARRRGRMGRTGGIGRTERETRAATTQRRERILPVLPIQPSRPAATAPPRTHAIVLPRAPAADSVRCATPRPARPAPACRSRRSCRRPRRLRVRDR